MATLNSKQTTKRQTKIEIDTKKERKRRDWQKGEREIERTEENTYEWMHGKAKKKKPHTLNKTWMIKIKFFWILLKFILIS